MNERLELTPDQHVEVTRRTGAFQRLRERFGKTDHTKGLASHALKLGDLYDIFLLYNSVRSKDGQEQILDYNPLEQGLTTAVTHAIFPDASIGKLRDLAIDVRCLDRSFPVFQIPVDLDKLTNIPGNLPRNEFEFMHNGLIIFPERQTRNINKTRYALAPTAQVNHIDRFCAQVFSETGLPILGS